MPRPLTTIRMRFPRCVRSPIVRTLAIFAAVSAGAAGASAQLQGATFQCEMDSSYGVSVRDMSTGRQIISPNRQAVWAADFASSLPSLRPDIAFEPRPDGYNVHFTFVNNTNKRTSVGEIYVPGIRFGQLIGTRDFRVDGKAASINHEGQNYAAGGLSYPEACYSPVAVVAGDGYTIGASLMYPILEYKHRVFIRVESPGGRYIYPGRNWQILFRLNSCVPTEGGYSRDGEIAPGETRRYTLAVRILKNRAGQHDNEWLRTLEPYRRYFKSVYGDVRYQRDPRPVLGMTMATVEHQSAENPMGFSPYQQFRADRYGFGPWTQLLSQLRSRGFDRGVLWAPSGLFYRNRENNYPFQFTSRWKQLTPMAQSIRELKQLADTGYDLGLWWGRAGQVMSSWDTASWSLLDPSNATHRRLAFKELDGAAEAGARLIGLDTFTHIPIWDAFPWLLEMNSRHPEMKFVVEPAACDILHTAAASYTLATTDENQIPCLVTSPHLLADFLNPGHETWGAIHTRYVRRAMGLSPAGDLTPDQMQREIRRVAAMGYVPVVFSTLPLSQPYNQFNASESWKRTIPTGSQETLVQQDPVAPPPVQAPPRKQTAPAHARKLASP